ncbi:succinate dehydrogenase/fumarate reductase iron-sulfur subunit [Bifidobacterium vespertilionis]|uniref:succinate dehydrogenase/fumarate reductase iron-sulfur subunit n=1 Tax=Bifidobacterium vespertilionis TaxID=2562524 RepID=UPI001BDCC01B|nr:2Fe-2S iron-sulfur cluster-binding protein [Bifidobacterium vespertilionis]MBT1178216.1 4Fe-4S dicluster domain-containing protein [Bifidobacterium vespertilionis]
MSNENDMVTVTLRVHRFTPRAERENRRSSNPFARKSSPFGDSGARRRTRGKQWTQDYTLRVRPEDTVLDCLLTVKRTIDPTLAFRYSCGHGMCGSDAVAINGTPTLLCTSPVSAWVRQGGVDGEAAGDDPAGDSAADDANDGFRRTGDTLFNLPVSHAPKPAANAEPGVIELSPLPGFPVQRDLIADIDPMLDQIRKLKPYLQAKGELKTTPDGKVNVFEYLQSPAELAKYEMLTNCIACGVCEGSCPVFAGGDAFIGPAALIAASRFVNDSRDGKALERMDQIDTADGVAACQSVRACGRQCPRGIDVGEEMWQIIAKVRER